MLQSPIKQIIETTVHPTYMIETTAGADPLMGSGNTMVGPALIIGTISRAIYLIGSMMGPSSDGNHTQYWGVTRYIFHFDGDANFRMAMHCHSYKYFMLSEIE